MKQKGCSNTRHKAKKNTEQWDNTIKEKIWKKD